MHVPYTESDALPPTLPELHHHISTDKRLSVNIFRWLDANNGDPALNVHYFTAISHINISIPSLGLCPKTEGSFVVSATWSLF